VDRLSIIIPTRRLEAPLNRYIRATLAPLPHCEVLVVEPDDQGSGRGQRPAEQSSERGDTDAPFRLVRARRGRGTQCNAGARRANGDLLFFLHDDTRLPDRAMDQVRQAFAEPAVGAACFRLRFDQRHWLLGLYAACSRFDSVWTTFGDQGLVIRRRIFDALGGFPDWPLFEDVELARRARRHSRIVKLPCAVTTSAERFRRNGILRQQLANALLMLRFLLGADPHRLAAYYERRRAPDQRGAR
jgi:rSAM/selenodomain-associated transferase 2